MTDKQHDALRLADALLHLDEYVDRAAITHQAAELLRTQHALLEQAREALQESNLCLRDMKRRTAIAAITQHLENNHD